MREMGRQTELKEKRSRGEKRTTETAHLRRKTQGRERRESQEKDRMILQNAGSIHYSLLYGQKYSILFYEVFMQRPYAPRSKKLKYRKQGKPNLLDLATTGSQLGYHLPFTAVFILQMLYKVRKTQRSLFIQISSIPKLTSIFFKYFQDIQCSGKKEFFSRNFVRLASIWTHVSSFPNYLTLQLP